MRNLLLSGGPGHDFAGAADAIADVLAPVGCTTAVTTDPDEMVATLASPDAGVDLLTVHALRWRMEQPRYAHEAARWRWTLDPEAAAILDAWVRGGGALLALHTAVICFDADPTWHALCGASWSWDRSAHPPAGPAGVALTDEGRAHPITAGLDDFTIDDEVYGDLQEGDDLVPLLTSAHGGRDHPVLWAHDVGAGRVVTDLLGHDPASFAHPVHRTVLGRAATWATRGAPSDG